MDMASITPEVLMTQLDRTYPTWAEDWADQVTLRDLVFGNINIGTMRLRVMHDLWPLVKAVYMATAHTSQSK